MVPNEALVDGFEVYTNWRNIWTPFLVDAKCNTKQQQNLAKIMNKNSKQTMPKALVSSHSSKKLKAQNFPKYWEGERKKSSTLSRVLLLNHHLKCYFRLATNLENKIT